MLFIKSLATHLQSLVLQAAARGIVGNRIFGAVVWVKRGVADPETNPKEHVALVISGWLSNYPSYGASGDAV